jgi:hypothetical protein
MTFQSHNIAILVVPFSHCQFLGLIIAKLHILLGGSCVCHYLKSGNISG